MLTLTPTTLIGANLAASALVVSLVLLAMRIPAACRAILRSRQRAEVDYHSERLKL